MIVRKIVISFCNNIKHFSNEINKRGGGNFFCGGWNFSKSVSVGSTFIREMRVYLLILRFSPFFPLKTSLQNPLCSTLVIFEKRINKYTSVGVGVRIF